LRAPALPARARHSKVETGDSPEKRKKHDPTQPQISRGEYAARLAKTRKAMEAKGVDLLIVSDPSNMAWLTGYDGWSFYVHQAVIVPPTGRADLVRPRPGRQRRQAARPI
jgi:ectoine hydrolase